MPTFDCPTCEKKLVVKSKDNAPFRPFCSYRCKQVDLGRWLDGTYTISDSTEVGDKDEQSDAEQDV